MQKYERLCSFCFYLGLFLLCSSFVFPIVKGQFALGIILLIIAGALGKGLVAAAKRKQEVEEMAEAARLAGQASVTPATSKETSRVLRLSNLCLFAGIGGLVTSFVHVFFDGQLALSIVLLILAGVYGRALESEVKEKQELEEEAADRADEAEQSSSDSKSKVRPKSKSRKDKTEEQIEPVVNHDFSGTDHDRTDRAMDGSADLDLSSVGDSAGPVEVPLPETPYDDLPPQKTSDVDVAHPAEPRTRRPMPDGPRVRPGVKKQTRADWTNPVYRDKAK